MIRRFIMIAVRRMLRARTGPPRQNMAAVPMRDIQIELDIAPAQTADSLFQRIGPRHHLIEPMFACGNFPVDHIVTLHHRSEEHTSELPATMRISYAVFCL